MADIAETLIERGKAYGNFEAQAKRAQEFKKLLWTMHEISDDKKEALEMICVKLARILNGDPNYIDNWVDIAGYATLVADRLKGEVQKLA